MNAPVLPFDRCGSTDIERRAIAFDLANQHVYTRIVELAREAKQHGVKRIGMKLLFEKLRWEHALATKGEKYLLNNDFTAHYTRLVQLHHPELADMFRTRKTAGDPEFSTKPVRVS